jgi:hypothetical protein
MVWKLEVINVTTPFDPPKLAIKERGKKNCKIFLKAHQDVLVNEVVQEITNKVTREIVDQVACEDVTLAKGDGISWGESPRQGGT